MQIKAVFVSDGFCFARGFLFRAQASDILRKELFQLLNKSLVVHEPTLCALWVRLGDLDKLPTNEHVWTGVITCGGGVRKGSGPRGLWRGLDIALQ